MHPTYVRCHRCEATESFSVVYFPLLNSSGSQPGAALSPGRHLMGDIFVVPLAIPFQWVEARGAATHPSLHRTAPIAISWCHVWLSHVWLRNPWTIPHQEPLSMGFSRQKITQPKISMVPVLFHPLTLICIFVNLLNNYPNILTDLGKEIDCRKLFTSDTLEFLFSIEQEM